MKHPLVLVTTLILVFSCPVHGATDGKEFITSVIYGTLAGTLVGAATLAFTSNPGDNLNNVARGASFGLYAGIFLGLYVTYGVPDGGENYEQQPAPSGEGFPEGEPPLPEGQGRQGQPQANKKILEHPLFGFFPIVSSLTNQKDFGLGVGMFNINF